MRNCGRTGARMKVGQREVLGEKSIEIDSNVSSTVVAIGGLLQKGSLSGDRPGKLDLWLTLGKAGRVDVETVLECQRGSPAGGKVSLESISSSEMVTGSL